ADLSQPHPARLGPDHLAGVPLQRPVLHVPPGPEELLRRPGRSHRAVSPAVCAEQFPGSGAAGPVLRHDRPQAHDRPAYTISAVLLALTGSLFLADQLTPTSQTLLWALVFFFASSAASSAYLTVSEIFPVELRGMVIALFFATGTLIGGTVAPSLFGHLIDTRSRPAPFSGHLP